MTTLEHAMLGINGLLATGLHRRHGWQLAAMAGLVSIAPDWDGLTLLGGIDLMDIAHRAWGHGLISVAVLGIVIGLLDYRVDLVTRLAHVFLKVTHLKLSSDDVDSEGNPVASLQPRNTFTPGEALLWVIVALLVALLHLPCDMIVSGGDSLTGWGVKIFWPFSDRTFAWPIIPWGHLGITLILVAGMFAMLRWKNRVQLIAIATWAVFLVYLLIRSQFHIL